MDNEIKRGRGRPKQLEQPTHMTALLEMEDRLLVEKVCRATGIKPAALLRRLVQMHLASSEVRLMLRALADED